MRKPTLLIISQVYVPDPTAVGQHIADAAAEMARRGYRVVVLTSRRGFEDAGQVYPKRETRDGVEIRRLPLSSFGKSSIAVRLLGAALFLVQALVRALWMRRPDGLLASTSPPMCSLVALAVSWLRRVPITYWVMDINPDQAVALGKFRASSPAVRLFDWLNRLILRRAACVVTLDKFMARRLLCKTREGESPGAEGDSPTESGTEGDSPIFALRKLGQSPVRKLGQSPVRKLGQSPVRKLGQSPVRKSGQSPVRKLGQSPNKQPISGKLRVIPPWPAAEVSDVVEHKANPFRRAHGLDGKFVFMYSGNISLVHSLDTILEAALYFQDWEDVVFLFVGGGRGRARVEEFIAHHKAPNIRLLPYQPLEQLHNSLSAADVHLVSMGSDMVGIVHPCKVYGIMACARPTLLIGPAESPSGILIQRHRIGWQVDHGDPETAIMAMREILETSRRELGELGQRAYRVAGRELSKHQLCGRFCDLMEAACQGRPLEAEELAEVHPEPLAEQVLELETPVVEESPQTPAARRAALAREE